ncbi:hypothetical protein PTSG_05390 [Salpingoeca rosetta]|uniref:Uncharacterized protein n=1 Tax=Salpingoeca rosetta (strain ATCC 50818 / BSB-021) TaxID=946362 RepID=F2UAA3_SALR5|nr:uncharacterized protein PTSG_05390 [Salpingoeca rosetta]EGD73678.1 hypothetical protein PTSG_05390 [Salpingoeca rosetta]|eukprot:XP_004993959.1 hypothetical protein PTSG_05390 [Salpingoeca rosetta]
MDRGSDSSDTGSVRSSVGSLGQRPPMALPPMRQNNPHLHAHSRPSSLMGTQATEPPPPHPGPAPTWREAADYLCAAKVLPGLPSCPVELASELRDGTRLCQLVQLLSQDQRVDFNQQPRREFLCVDNIHRFLAYCSDVGMAKESLFEAEDLFNGVHFERVVSTLSQLSTTPASIQQGLPRFPADRRASVAVADDDDDDDDEDESVYENLSELLEKLDSSQPIDLIVPASPTTPPDGGASGLAEDTASSLVVDHEADIYSSVVRSSHYGELKRKAKQRSERRMCCYQELVETERNFLECLHITDACYRQPLMTLLKENPALAPETGVCGSVFVEHRNDLLVYAEYCVDLPQAKAIMKELTSNKEVAAALKRMQLQSKQKFPLTDLLSVPMQRVLRYPLLLKELVKLTAAEDPRLEALQSALSTTQDVAKHVNECKHDIENYAIVQRLEHTLKDYVVGTSGCVPLVDHGRLLIDGDVKLRLESDGRAARRYIFLFQRVMLVCKAKNTGYHFFFSMNLKDFHIEPEWVKGAKIGVKLTTKVPSAMAFNSTLIFKSPATRDKWEELLRFAKAECSLDAPKHPKGGTHYFLIHSFDKPHTCDQCNLLLWGKFNQGLRCRYCHYAAHRQCSEMVDPTCKKSPQNQSIRDLLQRQKQPAPDNSDGREVEPSIRRRLATADKAAQQQQQHRFSGAAVHEGSATRVQGSGSGDTSKHDGDVGVGGGGGGGNEDDDIRPPPLKPRASSGEWQTPTTTANSDATPLFSKHHPSHVHVGGGAETQPRSPSSSYTPSDPLTASPAQQEEAAIGDRMYAVHTFHNRRDSRRGDLDFKRGDYIVLLDKSSPHWWKGRHERTGQIGMFPVSFCKSVRPHEPAPSAVPPKLSTAAARASTTASAGVFSNVPARTSSQLMTKGPVVDPLASQRVTAVKRLQSRPTHGDTEAPPVPPKSERVQLQMQSSSPSAEQCDDCAAPPSQPSTGSPPPLAARQQPSTQWFVGEMSRADAEEHLLLARDGSFVVRQSANADNSFVISLKHKGIVRHLRIVASERGFLLGASKTFPTIPELIKHFQRESLEVHFPDIDMPLLFACGTRAFSASSPRYAATYSFSAQAKDELSFEEGDVVEILKKTGFGKGWWLGRTRHGEGLVPSNYLEPMDSHC